MELLTREGEYWSVTGGGGVFRLRDSKGLRCLALLLAHPDLEFHALDLATVAEGATAAPARAAQRAATVELPGAGLGDAGELLDAEAKAAYRARLEDLRSDLEEAEAFNDPERADRARAEMGFLARELASAVGLGGRDRRAASAGERARVSVTRVIRSAIAKITEQDTALGRYLDTSVRTGTFCSYRPQPELEAAILAPASASRPAPEVRASFPPTLAARARELFGRSAELDRLRDWWSDAQGAAVMLITGEPGIGKTALAAELARLVHADEAVVLYGRCIEDGALPYHPFAEAVAPAVPSLEADFLHATGEEARQRLVLAVTRALLQMTDEQPLLLVLDDLHWADGGSVVLLTALVNATEAAALRVLATCRDAEAQSTPRIAGLLGWLARERRADELKLAGLAGDAVERLVATELADRPPEDFVESVIAQTDGNPFFVVELARDLAEAAGSDRVPRSVEHVIRGRVGRLSPSAQTLLRAAAVAGVEFDLQVLQRVLELTEDELLDALDEAAAAHLVIEDGERRDRFAFAHALVRDAVYEQIGRARCARLHASIGRAIEALHALDLEAHLPELAHHFSAASGAENAAKAAEYSARAGEQAYVRLMPDEAVRHYETALAAMADAPDAARRSELLVELGRVHWLRDDVDAAVTALSDAADAARAAGRPGVERRAQIQQLMEATRTSVSTSEDREEKASAAIAAAEREGDDRGLASALQVLALARLDAGDATGCQEAMARSLEHARKAGDLELELEARAWGLVCASMGGGTATQLLAAAEETAAWARAHDQRRLLARSLSILGRAHAMAGRVHEAVEAWREAWRAFRGLSSNFSTAVMTLPIVDVEPMASDPRAAEALLRPALAHQQRSHNVGVVASMAPMLADAVQAQGRCAEAIELTELSEQLAAGDDLDAQIKWRRARAKALARLGELEHAERLSREAVELSARTEFVHLHAGALADHAEVLERAGRLGEARERLADALALYQRKEDVAAAARIRRRLEGASSPASGEAAAVLEALGIEAEPAAEPETESDRRCRLLIELGKARDMRDDAEGALDALSDAVALARKLGRQDLERRARLEELLILRDANPPDWPGDREALAMVQAATAEGDDAGAAAAWLVAGVARFDRGELVGSQQALERSLEHARRARDLQSEAQARLWQLMAVTTGPTPAADMLRIALDAADWARATGHRHLEGHALVDAGRAHAMLGRPVEAIQAWSEARSAFGGLANDVALSEFVVPMVDVAPLASEPQAAEALLRPAFDHIRAGASSGVLASVAPMLADVVQAQGRLDEAIELTELSERCADEHDVDAHVRWRRTRAKALARRGARAEAQRLAREAVELVARTEFLHLHAQALADLGEVLEICGQSDEARAAFADAVGLYERKGDLTAIARIQSRLAGEAPDPAGDANAVLRALRVVVD